MLGLPNQWSWSRRHGKLDFGLLVMANLVTKYITISGHGHMVSTVLGLLVLGHQVGGLGYIYNVWISGLATLIG